MINFKIEILDTLKKFGYNYFDIWWIGCKDFSIPIDKFFQTIDTFIYEPFYYETYNHGEAFIPLDLIIVMNDGGWFSREIKYKCHEHWVFNKTPVKPKFEQYNIKSFENVNLYNPRLIDCISSRIDFK